MLQASPLHQLTKREDAVTSSRRSAATPQRKGAGEAGRMARLTQAAMAAQSPEVSNRQAEAAPSASGCDLRGDETTGREPGREGSSEGEVRNIYIYLI